MNVDIEKLPECRAKLSAEIPAKTVSPLAGMIPAYATSGPLFYVAILMLSGLVSIDWRDLTV